MGRPSSPVLPPFMEAIPIPEDLDGNWSNNSETLGVAIVYGLISMIIFIMQIFLPSMTEPLFEILFSLEWGIKVVLALTGTYGVVLFSLLIQSEVSNDRKRTRRCLQVLNIAFYVLSFNFGGANSAGANFAGVYLIDDKSHIWFNSLQLFALGFYGLLAVVFRWTLSNEQTVSNA